MSILRRIYPTHQQIEELFEAHEKGGREGIIEFLKKQDEEREKVKNTSGVAEAEPKPW